MGNTPSITDKKGSTYDAKGYNGYGFHRDTHLHKVTGTLQDKSDRDHRGFRGRYHVDTETRLDPDDYDVRGWKMQVDRRDYLHYIHYETKTEYNPDGFDYWGYNEEGLNRDGNPRPPYDPDFGQRH
jgi:hypothetical protein